ncbi:MAG TPA: adenylate/guanylate cyclase domain-containing protein [Acidimicrobiia bacterium]|jgi:predicted ATPase/class 3 adenylate cyclase
MQTFLFTDIEGSTRLWEEQPDEMAAALSRHDVILAESIHEASGAVLKTTGDGTIAVFDSAGGALAATVLAQKALSAEPWPSSPLRVRMGVHAGETENRDGDYFGPTMNRTARIMAAGHGGQILISAAVAELAAGQLPSGADLRDLGLHRLKDLTLPEHLYQLLHPDIDSDFPPPFTLDARPHNLPLQTTEFLGRSNELTAVQALLEATGTRLLTLAGPGGAGKTRLGLQVAAEQVHRFRDGVFFVDLSAERDSGAAFEAIVRILNLPVSGAGDPLQVLKTRLRDLEMLLVLDNFEQVTSAAEGVAELLQHAPALKVIVTSRETLRIRAERVFPVPPLALPHPRDTASSIAESESVQLFTERARAVRSGFAVTDTNASTIAEICLRLDGLPLAIELAAARLNVFTPAELLGRLQDRLDVLGAGGRDRPDRQRTLWGAIGWSYDLLDEGEGRLFELMAAFSTTRLPALEDVSAAALGMTHVVDSLASLVDKSLVKSDEVGGSQRFSMLQMIKEYAAMRLAESSEREEAVRRAHALHFSGFADALRERLRGSERDAALEDLESEIGNLRTAWRFWVERQDLEQLFHLIDGLWALHEAKGWYHAAIELASDTLGVLAAAEHPLEHAAEELTLRTSLARALMAVRGYGVEVEAAFRQVLEMSETSGSAAQRFAVLRALASYYVNTADFGRAAETGRRLLELGELEDDESIRLEAHYVLGASISFMGDLETGLPHLDRAIELYDPRIHSSNRYRLGPNTAVVARVASGLLLWQCGALERAMTRVAEALDLARRIDHPYSIAYALYHNAFLALDRGRFDECLERVHELAIVANENDYVVWSTLATVLEGVSATALGRVEEGLAMTEAAIDLYKGLTTPPVFWPLILSLRGMVHAMAGKRGPALAFIDEAIGTGPPETVMSPELWNIKGDILRMLPEADLDGAEEAYLSCLRESRARSLDLSALRGSIRLVGLRRETGRTPDGSDELASLYASFSEGLYERDLVVARDLLG